MDSHLWLGQWQITKPPHGKNPAEKAVYLLPKKVVYLSCHWISSLRAIKNTLRYHHICARYIIIMFWYVVGKTIINKMLKIHDNISPNKGVIAAQLKHKCTEELEVSIMTGDGRWLHMERHLFYLFIISWYHEIDYFPIPEIDFSILGIRNPDRYRIMYVLVWWTVYALTRGLFWCLFLELRSNKGNKHQNNTRVSA